MRISVLGSGSRGNAILVQAGDSCVLVDVGFGPRSLARRLAAVGCAPESIQAVVLTHEHVDHAGGALQACARWQWPLLATGGTLAALAAPDVRMQEITHGTPWSVGDLQGASLRVPHDAADCAALRLEHQPSGQRVGIALDLGHLPTGLSSFFERLDVLVVEANHDVAMLRSGPYPSALKQRIRGPLGHLDNAAAGALASECAHGGLRAVVLAHLSETNNAPALAVQCVVDALRRNRTVANFPRERVHAASQGEVLGPVGSAPARFWGASQFEFSL